MPDAAPRAPCRAVVILLDSLNRHLLGCYGGREFETPNLDRFARRAVRFDRHYAGSLPCMPARHDILCGALDFLWKPWGSIELWEEPITRRAARAGRRHDARLRPPAPVRDRRRELPHRLHAPGTTSAATRATRGRRAPTRAGSARRASAAARDCHYDDSRGWFRDESRLPRPAHDGGGRALARATTPPHHERFLLFVDEFDPHEPFDTPEPWASLYDPDWRGPAPHLAALRTRRACAKGVLDERQARQIRASYGAKLSMIDHWFGRVLDALDRDGLWDDTAVIVCTDHGHYLGEKDIWGKPGVPVLRAARPHPAADRAGPASRRATCDALTTNVDIFATLADLFGVDGASSARTAARSLPLLRGEATSVRDWALAGVWGREVHVIDGTGEVRPRARRRERAALDVVEPLVDDAGRTARRELRLPPPDDRAHRSTACPARTCR